MQRGFGPRLKGNIIPDILTNLSEKRGHLEPFESLLCRNSCVAYYPRWLRPRRGHSSRNDLLFLFRRRTMRQYAETGVLGGHTAEHQQRFHLRHEQGDLEVHPWSA